MLTSWNLFLIAVHDTYPQNEFLGIVIIEDAVEVITEPCVDLLGDLFHAELAIGHPLPVKLNPEEPGRDAGGIKVRHHVVEVDPVLVLGDDRALRFGVVVDGRVGGHLTEGGVLQATQDVL